jgi:protein-export membrane protein SecD
MGSHIRWLVLIILLTVFAVWVALPNTRITNIPENCVTTDNTIVNPPAQGIHIDTNNDCVADLALNVQQSLGLDLIGGLRVLLEAELPAGSYTQEQLAETANSVNRRVNGLGLTEATVQVQGGSRILVELPGVHDPQRAIDTIQETALLEFVDFGGLGAQAQQLEGRRVLTTQQLLVQQQHGELVRTAAQQSGNLSGEATLSPDATAEVTSEATPAISGDQAGDTLATVEPGMLNPVTGQPFETVITGAVLQSAAAQISTDLIASGEWMIQFELRPEGVEKFSAYTAANVGQPMAIVLDSIVLSAPTINDPLTTGGVISGNFTEDEAKQLALQLRSGALPIPVRVESAEEVGATLGQESVRLSIRAGVIGVIAVLSFMLIYYRVPGIAAALALLVFVALNLAAFKLIPVTLTLPAIVGFLISIGTAVDGNILIFERIKEELRAGKWLEDALVAGFDRAWNSIRDSNFSTIIICAILFTFGQTPGASIVSGFAVTLAIGLIVNLFTAIIVTRTFLHLLVAFLRQSLVARQWLLGI